MNHKDQIGKLNQMKQPSSRLWYVIQTKPANEHRVERNLINQGIETFLPLIEVHHYINGKIVTKTKPLFPNYLFGKLDIEFHYFQVKYTRGVNKVLGFADGPIPISEKVIEMIRERVGEGNVVRLEEEFKEGDQVQICSGVFKDLIGVFQKKISDQGRVRILLGMLGVEVPVQISKWQLKKVA